MTRPRNRSRVMMTTVVVTLAAVSVSPAVGFVSAGKTSHGKHVQSDISSSSISSSLAPPLTNGRLETVEEEHKFWKRRENLKTRLENGKYSSDRKWRRRTRQARRQFAEKYRDDIDMEKRQSLLTIVREHNYFTNVDGLRDTFGPNKNRLWGDLDAATSRKLYKSLLPRALLGLYHLGIVQDAQDLAPLAYEARLAAKRYARERSQVPAKVMAMAYDGFRHWRRYGQVKFDGMTWDQVWEKYEDQIMAELREDAAHQDVTAQICLRILERSCATNSKVDNLVLGQFKTPNTLLDPSKNKTKQIKSIKKSLGEKMDGDGHPEGALVSMALSRQLEKDVRTLLAGAHTKGKGMRRLTPQEVFALRLVAAAKKQLLSPLSRLQWQRHEQERASSRSEEPCRRKKKSSE